MQPKTTGVDYKASRAAQERFSYAALNAADKIIPHAISTIRVDPNSLHQFLVGHIKALNRPVPASGPYV